MTTATNTTYADAKRVDVDDIPVIDLADLMAHKPGAVQDVASKIVDASTRIGFFYIRNHSVPQDVIEAASRAMRDYFALPPEKKALTPVNTSQRGWMATGMAKLEGSKTHDLKEIFFWGPEAWHPRLDARKGVDSLVADNVWPDAAFPALRKELLPYYDHVQRVGRELLSAIAVGLNLSADFFKAKYTSPMARGQLVYYPVSTAKDDPAAPGHERRPAGAKSCR
jgi:isopenicillin N synthase-like dioxygenase